MKYHEKSCPEGQLFCREERRVKSEELRYAACGGMMGIAAGHMGPALQSLAVFP